MASVFGRQVLTEKQNSFSVSFPKIGDDYAWVGVVDQSYRSIESIDEQLPNWICYSSDGGTYNEQEWTEGDKFECNELITVKIDFKKGTVEWIIEGEVRRSVENELLLNKNIKWVPYLNLFDSAQVRIE